MLKELTDKGRNSGTKWRAGSIQKAASLFFKLWNRTDKQITPVAESTASWKYHQPLLNCLLKFFLLVDKLYISMF